MPRDVRVFLWDDHYAAAGILEFVAGKNYADYAADRILDAPQIIAFRNPLIQGFASVIDLAVWRAPLKSLYRIFTKFWQVF